MTDALHEDQYTFMIISRSVLLRMRNASEKCCSENKNTRFMFKKNFLQPPPENRSFDEIMWKNMG